MRNEIIQILDNADKDDDFRNIPATMLYEEGWLLRIILQQIKEKKIIHDTLTYPDDSIKWFSEAWLPSPFISRGRNSKYSETHTRADGVVGKFMFRKGIKAGLSLQDSCDFFYVIEAKMYSRLSMKTKNSDHYNQAARYIGCISRLIYDKHTTFNISDFKKLGFYVLLPEKQIQAEKTFTEFTDKNNIITIIKNRISDYTTEDRKKEEAINWLNINLEILIDKIDIKLITWEELVNLSNDTTLNDFYEKCKKYNKKNK